MPKYVVLQQTDAINSTHVFQLHFLSYCRNNWILNYVINCIPGSASSSLAAYRPRALHIAYFSGKKLYDIFFLLFISLQKSFLS